MTFVAKFKIKEQDTIKAKFTLDVKPKKVSQLENDLHFQTDEQVASTVQTAVEEVTIETDAKIAIVNETINDLSNVVEQNYSELDNKIIVNHQEITDHIDDKNNPHEVTKTQIGLGNVDNTSDLNKPISTATQNALNTKVDKTSVANRVYGTDANGNQTTYSSETFGKVDDVRVDGVSVVTNKIANLGSMANEDADDYSTTTEANSLYAEKSLETTVSNHISNKNNPHEVTKTQIGLGNVDNTSDLNKPVSTATQTALDTLSNTVSSNYTTLNTRITNETATLNTAITTEETNRQNADNNLQSQIDAITSASDVTDIVGTYAELQAYDTTGLPDKSIIKVLQDESRNDETTYYRWVITNNVGAWVLIGEEGPYYTKSEADGKFVDQSTTVNGKALSSNIVLTSSDVGALSSSTTINDLTTLAQQNALNSGITSAKVNLIDTSIQPGDNISQLTNDANYISGINQSDVINALGYTPYNATNPNNYATETYVNNGLATKQDSLTSDNAGTDIEIVNSAGNMVINFTGTIPTVNNSTITFTQGGVPKGTITLNQSNNQTIALDAGGSGTANVPDNILAFSNDAKYISEYQLDNSFTVTETSGQQYPYANINNTSFSMQGDVSTSLTKNGTTLQLFTFANGKIDVTKHIVMDFHTQAEISEYTDSYVYGNYTLGNFADTVILGKLINGIFTPKIYVTSDTMYEVQSIDNIVYNSGITTYTLTTSAIATFATNASGADMVTIQLKDKNTESPSWRFQLTACSNGSQITYETIWTNSTTSYTDLLADINTIIFVENTTNIPVRCVGEWEQALYYTPEPLRTVNNMSTLDIVGLSASLLDNYVTLTGAQTISGVKYFSNGLKIMGESGIKDNNDVSFIRTNPNLTNNSYVWEIGSTGSRAQDFNDIYMTTTRGSHINIDANNITNYLPTVDQTYDGTSTDAQSGVAIEGELANYQSKLVSGINIKTVNNTSLLGSGNINLDSLPAQTGQSGKFLTTNGSVASWSDTTKVTFRDWSVT